MVVRRNFLKKVGITGLTGLVAAPAILASNEVEARTAANPEALKVFDDLINDLKNAQDLVVGDLVMTKGYYAKDDGGHALYLIVDASTVVPTVNDLLTDIVGTTGVKAQLMLDPVMDLRAFGAKDNDQAAFQTAINVAAENKVVVTGKLNLAINSSITIPNNLELIATQGDITIRMDSSFASTEYAMLLGWDAVNVSLSGLTLIGNLEQRSSGSSMYGMYFERAKNCIIKNCKVEKVDMGIFFRSGSEDCTIESCEAFNCWYLGIGGFGYADPGFQVKRMKFIKNKVHMSSIDVSSTYIGNAGGVMTEFVFDSHIYCNTVFHCGNGVRIEDSARNIIESNICYLNNRSGVSVYGGSRYNTVMGNQCYDNNTGQHSNIGPYPYPGHAASNLNTQFCGINIESHSHYNIISGNMCYRINEILSHQQYGIGINIRRIRDDDQQMTDRWNIVTGNQCLNNMQGGIEDRGSFNTVSANVEI